MKKILIIISVLSFFLGSCEKETEGVSSVTQFVEFEMEGDQYMSIPKGGTYTEAGVKATEGDAEKEVTITGEVDVNTVGIYEIVYSSVNKDGYPGSVTRTVAILPEPEHEGADLSGKYKNDGSFNYTAEMVKLAPGFYTVDNVWGGGSAAVIPAYVISSDAKDLILPTSALSGYGRVRGTGTLVGNKLTYVISLLDQGLSDSERKWTKQ